MSAHLLVIDSSARVTRSLTRQLTQRAAAGWQARHPRGHVDWLDVGRNPPPALDEAWIAAAYTRAAQCTPAMREALRVGDGWIDRVLAADAIVIGAPVYNFGVPAALKGFFEQIVRIGRTFDFGPGGPDDPYVGLVADRPVLVVTASGSLALQPGGTNAALNFLEPQLTTILHLMGLRDLTFARVGGQQAEPEAVARALTQAEAVVDGWNALAAERSVWHRR